MKKYWLYILIILMVSVVVIVVQNTEKKPLDWRSTFSRHDKIPYGTYVLYDLLPEIFKGQQIENINKPLYEALDAEYVDKNDSDHYLPQNYIFINSSGSLDSNACKRLLMRVYYNGSNVFMAEENFPDYLKDTLNFQLKHNDDTFGLKVNFVNPLLKASPSNYFKKLYEYNIFSFRFNKSNTTILATNQKDSVIMIKVKFGKGAFYLSSAPYLFTNYYLLENNSADVAFKSLSYMPLVDTYWYEYSNAPQDKVVLSYILSQAALRWAFYLLLFGIIAYVIFEGKRKQRIIPIIPPVKNTSLEFAETVGQLYYHHKDHINLARKMISHFYDFIRTRLFIKTNVQDENFYKQVALKSGMQGDEIRGLFTYFEQIEMHGQLTEEQLIELNARLDNFYKKTAK